MHLVAAMTDFHFIKSLPSTPKWQVWKRPTGDAEIVEEYLLLGDIYISSHKDKMRAYAKARRLNDVETLI
jgi:hypothetical protein